MKKLLILFLLLSPIYAYSQVDSTTIDYVYLDQELSLINELNDIQFISITCSDQAMKGKKFSLTFDEYLDGVKIDQDTSNLSCEVKRIPIETDKGTVYYIIDECQKKTFGSEDSIYKINLAGKLQKDTFKLKINYPAFLANKKWVGNEDYLLRPIDCSSDHKIRVALNQLTPILAYTPPFQTESGLGSYCMLETEKVDKWFQKFNIKHYYIINIKIQ